MKYIVEIDTDSKVGEEAIKYLRTLKKSGKAVYIREVEEIEEEDPKRPITVEEMALPIGRVPTDAQLEEFLDRKQGRGSSLETVRKRLLKKIADRRKNA